ncbi:hypothetical protein EG327_006450 [Venturia inaequalis]|uniref:C2H2-type domain-containing protein n=1 Tax=Venturia inaequalis TaxID=5025 RepID=A0A8H3VT56_VENIN|nr:hypothetical protein EG327_006450 [Venturia inaequalis]
MDDNVVYDQAFWDQLMLDFGRPGSGNGQTHLSVDPSWATSYGWSTAVDFQSQPSQPPVINGLLFEESNYPGAQIIRELPPPMSLGSGSVHEPVTFETSNTPSSSETFEALKETSAIRCPHKDCQYSKATFKRRSDLKRHSRKHEGTTAFSCSAIGCRIRGIKASFIRPDKLREHFKAPGKALPAVGEYFDDRVGDGIGPL